MIRPTFVALSLVVVAQSLPNGCPAIPPGDSPPDSTPRGTIETHASAPSSAAVGQTVELSAVADESGGAVSYSWLQIAGPGVSINRANSARAAFIAPSLPEDQTLRFVVTTSRANGDVGRAEVAIRVAADPDFGAGEPSGGGGGGPRGPSARAGGDQTVEAGTQVTLDGSSSRGESLRFQWRQVSGTTVALSGATSIQATFLAPAFVENSNRLEFELIVRDARGRSSSDRVTITIRRPAGIGAGDAAPRVLVSTTLGNFTVELNPEKAPVTVENFLRYVDDGFYDGTLFHRVVPGFVIQGGGLTPGLIEKSTRDPIENEAAVSGLKNLRGTIAMARTFDPNSATSQFFINLVDNPSLDAGSGNDGYAVFGRVVQGMDVVDRIAQVQTESRSGFTDVPVRDVLIRSITRISSEEAVP